ncbi:uncharacterized protein LOC112164813 [Rosa chinensis]|uniref:uncharacterized protein LOC112164813 n=1 Tax=Rosa chinensis TaxID=74649 RepID=UPI001AD8B6BA|nr:uncharacterized protein LOC112164813 [Rosa chinensis]
MESRPRKVKGRSDEIKSRRWKQVSQPIVATDNEALEMTNEDMSILEHRDKRIRTNRQIPTVIVNQPLSLDEHSSNNNTVVPEHVVNSNSLQFAESADIRGECSQSFGQALYQRTKQGSVVTYEDSGDNVYTCKYFNACFWVEEAIKQKSTKALPIYTNCCQKGEIKLPVPKPTPNLLKTLLNPNNGPDSKLFKENIRVYNSMFSFTSMGATIDHKINTGSGPYVFKISGQVHHLMGSILPSDGESPKYAQLYIYDTNNEISNRINAIDPLHVNQNIKPEIVEGLTKIWV